MDRARIAKYVKRENTCRVFPASAMKKQWMEYMEMVGIVIVSVTILSLVIIVCKVGNLPGYWFK